MPNYLEPTLRARAKGFKPVAFWVFPALTPHSLRSTITAYLSDPWVKA